ncbi:amino acid adenylation domain-containing protein [Branchiibius hedensis]|uniref:Amino acid adenylation domain-containing protein n=1 Tax=Branchiibius hedensis TaxID=672460 RepID=A0A2Y9BPH7_9MICO|nr:AMP-binding protein [Branchiibius hedensis]PWJ23321.1 amino acid adenylation domain-containing protein [Branchiibius hedensis]SSA59010.1 amino acid adenylation domain-containing protein [Branchiibius hedensis]
MTIGSSTGVLWKRFEASARAHPEATALEVGDQRVTYCALAAEAAAVASHVETHLDGAGAVALCGQKTAATYAAYLGILKSGSTLVPVDPDWPAERLRQVLIAAGCVGVVSDGSDLGEVLPGLPVLDARPERMTWSGPPDTAGRPLRVPTAEYLMFTSGSTGRPKGVPIRRQQLAAYLDFAVEQYAAETDSRVSQVFSLTFDPSVHDLFLAWSSGSTLVVPPGRAALAPAAWIASAQITHWASPPSVAEVARRFRTLSPGSMPALQYGVFMGDQLRRETAEAWRRAAPACRVVNAYGPTETTITVTSFSLQPGEPCPRTSNDTVPIGQPNPGTTLRVTDAHGDEAETGELWVGGKQVFDGYLDVEESPTCFADGAAGLEARWYRTGDRVVQTADGLVHLGRIDRQVKVGSFRVELTEVETALRGLGGVVDGACFVVDDRLAAVFTVENDEIQEGYIRDGLAKTLPRYSIPHILLQVDLLPVTTNGKVDQTALVALVKGRASVPARQAGSS